jgi:plasmid stabilization system protein ParE
LIRFLTLTEEAEQDLLEARDWYDKKQIKLGDDFLFAVDACFASIERNPDAFAFSHGRVRRALMKKFPYVVLFRVSEEEILIVGCLHTRRDRSKWEER